MRGSMKLAAIGLAVAAAPVAAQTIPAMTLVPGEAITVQLGNDDRAGAPERQRAEWSAFDVFAARHLSGITPPDAPVPVGTPLTSGPDGPRPEPTPLGQVRVRFFSIAERHTLLVVENGLQRAIAYRARMTRDGDTRPTDVCLVMPGLPSYEHWPHTIDRIELTDFRYVQWQPGQPPTCE